MRISDFCITNDNIPQHIADKILEFHLQPIQRTSEYLGYELAVSKKSAWRPLWWELSKGRSGGSQHVFLGKGACDITTLSIREKQIELSKGLITLEEYYDFVVPEYNEKQPEITEALIDCTDYTRIAQYNTFTHGDYGIQDERWIFDSKWRRIKKIQDGI